MSYVIIVHLPEKDGKRRAKTYDPETGEYYHVIFGDDGKPSTVYAANPSPEERETWQRLAAHVGKGEQ